MEGFATLRFEHGDEFGQAHLFMRGDCSGKVQNTPSARHVITKTMKQKNPIMLQVLCFIFVMGLCMMMGIM